MWSGLRRFAMLPLIGWMAGCATGGGPALKINTSDDQKATREISSFLRDNGYSLGQVSDEWFSMPVNDTTYILQPKCLEDGLDRLLVRIFWGVKDEYKGSPDLIAMVTRLNTELNVGQFYLDEDGDLVFLSTLTYTDQLQLDEIQAFFDWNQTSLLGLALSAPEIFEYLK